MTGQEPHRIDVHAHYLAPLYREALQESEMWLIGGIPVPDWTPELALGFMNAEGIAVQMLSVSDPGVEFVDGASAPALARACNDYVAGVVREHPGRFGAFAVLSVNTVEEAVEEAVRALDDLSLDGVGLLSSYAGRYPGDPVFEPLLSELDRRGAWVMVHPASVAPELKPDLSVPGFIAEYPFDTTRAFMSLLFNGVFERHPNIRWQFAHGGGTLPMLRARLSAASAAAREFRAVSRPARGLRSAERRQCQERAREIVLRHGARRRSTRPRRCCRRFRARPSPVRQRLAVCGSHVRSRR